MAPINWHRLAISPRYNNGTALERRFIELRVSVATAVRALRWRARLHQRDLAAQLGTTQARVSQLERAHLGVSFDFYVRALLVLGATEAEISAAFDCDACVQVQSIRRYMSRPYSRRPARDGDRSRRTRREGRVARGVKDQGEQGV